MRADKYALLKRHWGYESFRPQQEDIIDSVLAGHDTMALLPTGGGKSLCYQLPALMLEGLTLVVSPLIALMKDQVQHLNDRHVKAACIVSGMSRSDVAAVLNNSITGTIKLLYVSPERLQQLQFIEHFRRMKVSMIAVDEAHCVSQWGYDFRPPYLNIVAVRQYHPSVPLIALTATATPTVLSDIMHQLGMRQPHLYRSSFLRGNLSYEVLKTSNKITSLVDEVRNASGSTIVYTRSRRETVDIAKRLSDEGLSAIHYHAGLTPIERDRRQKQWMSNQYRIMVATTAFGMGIDKPDVRLVVHASPPESVEAYFQEAGRAGRDGLPARALLLYSDSDDARLNANFASEFPSVKYIRNAYRALCNYYKLPLGSGADTKHDYQLEQICAAYNFQPRLFFSACHFLERAGLIAIPDREDLTSTVFIPYGRDEIYRFQVAHIRLGGLLQEIMRRCPGVCQSAVPIDEAKFARSIFADPSEVTAMLTQLHEMHVLEYTPRTTKPQIIFTSPRINENNIYLTDEVYGNLKSAAQQRLDDMLAYLHNDRECRSRQLLAYFGEADSADCGLCDVCKGRQGQHDVTREEIISTIGNAGLTIADLCRLLGSERRQQVCDMVRMMLDRGDLHMDADMRLSVS